MNDFFGQTSNFSSFNTDYGPSMYNQEFTLDINFMQYARPITQIIDFFNSDQFCDQVINKIESNLYSAKYYGYDKTEINKYRYRFISNLLSCLSPKENEVKPKFEREFIKFALQISKNKKNFKSIVDFFIKEIESNLREVPIKTTDFPHYIPRTNPANQRNEEDLNFQKDEELLKNILDQENNNNNNRRR